MDVGRSALWFLGGWLIGNVLGGLAIALFAPDAADPTIPVFAISLLGLWSAEMTACVLASRSIGTSDIRSDLGLSARPIDLFGVPIGAVTQLLLIPAVYMPLRQIWPDTFTDERLEETARDLVERADGGMIVLLVAFVVIGAPLVEEILYRGLLQRPGLDRFPRWIVIVAVAAVFALFHFRPIEFVGLFVAGLVFGVCAARTGRLGMAITTHVGFNATGVFLVL